MAETDLLVAPETDISSLEDALCAQQQLLQQLYTDLDVEREASSSAASEALSMILRLQGEKASLKMEACQYKRMAEEKICHAEEALAIFEDLIYQREMEIASLEFQVQAYRYKLVSMGCNDLDGYENKFPDNLLMQRNDTGNDVKRLNSPPPQIQIKDSSHKKFSIERKRSMLPMLDYVPSVPHENTNQEANDLEKKPGSSACGDINFYWEQIKKLDERVKGISDVKDSCRNKSSLWKGGTWSPSLFSQVLDSSVDPKRGANFTISDQIKHQNLQEKESGVVSSACSSSVQDIFEVPKTIDNRKACHLPKRGSLKLTLETENRLGKPDVICEDDLEAPNKENIDHVKTILPYKKPEKKIPKPKDGKSIDRNVSIIRSISSIPDSQAEYQQLIRRIERLERATNSMRQEIVSGGEEMNMLRGICEQLKSIESEMRSLKSEKALRPKEPSLDPLRDAMLYFWL